MGSMINEQLAGELDRLGIPFLPGEAYPGAETGMDPVRLIAGLAMSDEARLRLAILPLLILHPEYAASAFAASRDIAGRPRFVLQCYYSAAMLLQRKYANQLAACLGPHPPLPDLFSATLGVRLVGEPEACLRSLAARQAQLSGDAINWQGTYEHAVRVLLRHKQAAEFDMIPAEVRAHLEAVRRRLVKA